MEISTEATSISTDTSSTSTTNFHLTIDSLEQKVFYYKQQCSKLLSIILNDLKEASHSSESFNGHFETLTNTISEHLTSKYEVEFAFMKERDEAMKTMEKKVEDLELELKETREASKISEDGINLLIKIRKEDAETQVEKPMMRDSSTSTELDSNQNLIPNSLKSKESLKALESTKSALQRYAVEDTVRLENELRTVSK